MYLFLFCAQTRAGKRGRKVSRQKGNYSCSCPFLYAQARAGEICRTGRAAGRGRWLFPTRLFQRIRCQANIILP